MVYKFMLLNCVQDKIEQLRYNGKLLVLKHQ